MKKPILLLLTLFIGFRNVGAHSEFELTVRKEVYKPLEHATVISGPTGWMDPEYSIPLLFGYQIGDTTINTLHISSSVAGAYRSGNRTITGYAVSGRTLCDRGLGARQSASLIRYTTTGAPGKRIFKLEFHNAGFYDEYFQYGTNADYVNMQLWLCEETGAAEYHFGPSEVKKFNASLSEKQDFRIGFVSEMNVYSKFVERMSLFSGSNDFPLLTDVVCKDSGDGLKELPAEGTVYRLIPQKGVAANYQGVTKSNATRVYPAAFNESVHIENPLSEAAKYEMLSSYGAVVSKGTLPKGSTSIDTQDLQQGMYVLVVSTKSIVEFHKITK